MISDTEDEKKTKIILANIHNYVVLLSIYH